MFSGNGLDAISMCMPLANPWIQRWFKECIYTPWEMAGFFIGLSSVMFWIVAQVPQFVSNFSRQSADALSPWFLVQWLAGDSCNFIGCLLTGDQLVTETITAAYFIFSDIVILSQYLYYRYKGRGKQFGAYASDSDESLHKPSNGYYEALQNGTASQLDKILVDSTAETVIQTKRDACEFCRLGTNSDRQGSPTQICVKRPETFTTTDSQKVSSGMYQTTVTNTDHSIPEDRSSPKHCSCAINRVDHLQGNAACSSRSTGLQKHGHDCCFPTKKGDNLQRVVMQYGLEYNIPSAVKSSKRHMLSSGKNSGNAASHVRKSRAKVAFCFTGLLILGTWSCHSLLGDPTFERNSVPNGDTVISLGRRSLKEVHQEDQSFPERLLGQSGSAPLWTRDIGRLVGWISSALYLSSRISQLLKNRSRKSAEGLSLGMVGCAMMANITYGLAILMLTKSWGDLVGKAPWLVGSLGTVSLDFTMFIQAYYFRYRYGKITIDECNPLLP